MINTANDNTLASYDTGLLRKQISENSKKIDQYLVELKELEERICGVGTVRLIA